MSQPASQNKNNLQGEPWADEYKSEQGQTEEHDSKEDKPSKDETNGKSAKKVRFQDDLQIKDPETKKPRHEDNHEESTPTTSNITFGNAETIKALKHCLSDAKADLKRVQERLEKLQDKKKALHNKEEDFRAEIDMFQRSIKKKLSFL